MSSIESFLLAPGFRATATACGLKPSGNLDLALVAAERACSAAGVFTTNRVKAAPVLYDQAILAENAGSIRAVITNAGCANACTGAPGMLNARAMAALTAEQLGCKPEDVLVMSTGVIGRQLDMHKLRAGIAVVGARAARHSPPDAAVAITTTDTRPKTAVRQLAIGGKTVTISGFCKGAGMIHPNMATMLAIVTTDADVDAALLASELQAAVERSFNRISVDGDMSTNDTVLLLASGVSGVRIDAEGAAHAAFANALADVCTDLARQVARDGEGATRLVEISVTGARSAAEAHQVANSIACSPLFKCAVHGGDPNWGRVLCAAGYSGADIDPDRLALAFGAGEQAVQVVGDGLPLEYDERAAAALLRHDPVLVRLDLGLGDGHDVVWTCDMSAEYVAINAHYTT
jgi:glutamate N-acetyltransferase/amino-acid N-acetyltransferase